MDFILVHLQPDLFMNKMLRKPHGVLIHTRLLLTNTQCWYVICGLFLIGRIPAHYNQARSDRVEGNGEERRGPHAGSVSELVPVESPEEACGLFINKIDDSPSPTTQHSKQIKTLEPNPTLQK